MAKSKKNADRPAKKAAPGTVRPPTVRNGGLPSREELLAKLAGTLQAPIVKLVRTMNEVPGRFVRTLAAVHAAREKAAT